MSISRRLLEWLGEPLGDAITRVEGHRLILGGGGGGSKNTTTSTSINYSPEEAARRTQVMDEAQRIYQQNQGAVNAGYPGPAPVGQDWATSAAQNQAIANAGQAQGQVNALNQGVQYGLTGAMDVRNNPYLQQAIMAANRPLQQQFQDAGGTLSQIRTNAGEAGQVGSSRQGIAEGLAAGRLAQAQSDMAAKMSNEAYRTGQETFQKTLMFAPQAIEAGNIPVNMLSSVGAQRENLAQQQEDYAAQQRMWGMNAPWLGLQNYAGIVYGGAAPSTESTSTAPAAARNPIGQALGAGLSAYSMYQLANM